jgi:hypothetical protein
VISIPLVPEAAAVYISISIPVAEPIAVSVAVSASTAIVAAIAIPQPDDDFAESVFDGIAQESSKRENSKRNKNEHHGVFDRGDTAMTYSFDTTSDRLQRVHAPCPRCHSADSLPANETSYRADLTEGHA